MNSIERKSYNGLDIGKIIAALFIIIIHTSPLASYSTAGQFLLYAVTTIAVPFFFTTAAFLFFDKIKGLLPEERDIYFKKYILKLIKMYLIWSGVYFLFVLQKWITSKTFSYIDVINYIKAFFVSGSFETIWYLLALTIAMIVLYFLIYKIKIKLVIVFVISVLFYIFGLLGSSYYFITVKFTVLTKLFNVYFELFNTIKNGFCFAMIFCFIGFYIANKKIELSNNKKIILCILTGIVTILEISIMTYLNLENKGYSLVIGLILFAATLVLFLKSLNLKNKNSYVFMRKMSVLIFLTQRIFLTLYPMLLKGTRFNVLCSNSLIYFFLIAISTWVFSYIILKLSNKFSLLKNLY